MPLSRALQLQVWLPLLNIAAASSLGQGGAFWGDVFLHWYVHGNSSGLFVGPGIGVIAVSVNQNGSTATGIAPELAGRVGYELTGQSRRFAFTIAARPWMDVLVATSSNSSSVGFGYGGMLELGFHLYATRAP